MKDFTDVDWGSSYPGLVFKLGEAAVTWKSRKQRTIALSSTEAEYIALTKAAKEAVYWRNFLKEVGL